MIRCGASCFSCFFFFSEFRLQVIDKVQEETKSRAGINFIMKNTE